MIQTHFYPNLPQGYCLVSCDELERVENDLSDLDQTLTNMGCDLTQMVDHLERIIDLDNDVLQLVQSAEGIVRNATPALDAHKLRTIKGQLKKARQDCAYLQNAYNDADMALDEVVQSWAFLRPDD